MIDKILKEKPVYTREIVQNESSQDQIQISNKDRKFVNKTNKSFQTTKQPQSLCCPIHPQQTAEYFCTEEHCKQISRIMCKTCILQGPHRIHDNVYLNEVISETNRLREPLEVFEESFCKLDFYLEQGFKKLQQVFESGINMIKHHYLNEILPETNKLFFLREYLEITKKVDINQNLTDKKLNEFLYTSVSNDKEKFFENLKPNSAKLDLFFDYFNDKLIEMEEETKKFMIQISNKFITQFDYTRYQKMWAQDEPKDQNNTQASFFDSGLDLYDNFQPLTIQNQQHIFKGHTSYISDIKKLNNQMIASCSYDRQICVWDTQNLKLYTQIITEFPIKKIEYIPQTYIACIGNQSRQIYIYDWVESILHYKLYCKEFILSLCCDKSYLYAGSENGTVYFFDLTNFSLKHLMTVTTSMISSLQSDSQLLVAGDKFGNVIILMEFKQILDEAYFLKNQSSHKDMIMDIIILDQNRLVTSSYDKRIILWNYNKSTIIQEILQFNYSIYGLIEGNNEIVRTWKLIRYKDNILAMVGEDNKIQFYDMKIKQFIHQIQYQSNIYAMEALDDQRLVVGGKQGNLIIFN